MNIFLTLRAWKQPQSLSRHRGLSSLPLEAPHFPRLGTHCPPSPAAAFHRPFPLRKRNHILCPFSRTLCFFDPFADASKGDDLLPAGTEDYIHIRIQQRNGRKTLTTVQGIADDYDKKKLVKAFKKKFACNGTVIEHPEYGEVIQLQGDQRKNICQFLVEIGLAKDDQLKVHGF